MSHLSTLYELAKTEQMASNSNNKNKIYIFPLAFFLLYIIWIKIIQKLFSIKTILFLLSHSHQNNWKYEIRCYRYLYRYCLDIFPNHIREWIHRDRIGEVWFSSKIFIGLENMINKSEKLPNYLMKNKKKNGRKRNKNKTSDGDAKEFYAWTKWLVKWKIKSSQW